MCFLLNSTSQFIEIDEEVEVDVDDGGNLVGGGETAIVVVEEEDADGGSPVSPNEGCWILSESLSEEGGLLVSSSSLELYCVMQ